jgi:hypothetical protein
VGSQSKDLAIATQPQVQVPEPLPPVKVDSLEPSPKPRLAKAPSSVYFSISAGYLHSVSFFNRGKEDHTEVIRGGQWNPATAADATPQDYGIPLVKQGASLGLALVSGNARFQLNMYYAQGAMDQQEVMNVTRNNYRVMEGFTAGALLAYYYEGLKLGDYFVLAPGISVGFGVHSDEFREIVGTPLVVATGSIVNQLPVTETWGSNWDGYTLYESYQLGGLHLAIKIGPPQFRFFTDVSVQITTQEAHEFYDHLSYGNKLFELYRIPPALHIKAGVEWNLGL